VGADSSGRPARSGAFVALLIPTLLVETRCASLDAAANEREVIGNPSQTGWRTAMSPVPLAAERVINPNIETVGLHQQRPGDRGERLAAIGPVASAQWGMITAGTPSVRGALRCNRTSFPDALAGRRTWLQHRDQQTSAADGACPATSSGVVVSTSFTHLFTMPTMNWLRSPPHQPAAPESAGRLPSVNSSPSHVARTAYEAFLADLQHEPSAAECERWAADHAGDPDEPRALVDAGWSTARGGDSERALELFRRAAGYAGEFGRDAQVGIAEQLYALQRDQEADEVQRALRAELDDQPGGLGTVRIFDDMTEMLSDADQDRLALEWCQAGLDRATEADNDPEVGSRRRRLLITRGYLREKLGIELDDDDLEARAEADSSLAKVTAMMRERLGPLLGGSDESAFDAIVLRWVREDFSAVRSRWPKSTAHYGDDYETYAGRIQREARMYEDSGATRVHLIAGGLADYESYTKAQRRDPADPSTRQDYGEWCIKARPERVRIWPPERNGACWCDSGRKYKKCCGAPARN